MIYKGDESMKKIILLLFTLFFILLAGCNKNQITESNVSYSETKAYQGAGYSITVPDGFYRFEKDYDDGNLEEKWEHLKYDDVDIKVTTYKNIDEATALNRFLSDNDDFIFEDLTGSPICGTEPDGDTLWFTLYKSDTNVYVVSWEYPKYVDESIKKELSEISQSFTVTK